MIRVVYVKTTAAWVGHVGPDRRRLRLDEGQTVACAPEVAQQLLDADVAEVAAPPSRTRPKPLPRPQETPWPLPNPDD